MIVPSRILVLGLLAFASAFSGCASYDVEAKMHYEEGSTLAVLPTKDPEFMGLFASPRGREISVIASDRLALEFYEDIVLPDKYLEQFLRLDRKWLEKGNFRIDDDSQDPADMTLQQIADKVATDYILVSEIIQGTWRTRPPRSLNFMRGSAVLRVRLFDNREGKLKLISSERVAVRYPTSFDDSDGVSSMSTTDEEIEEGLVRTAGRYMAELFYEHDLDAVLKVRMR